MRQHLLRGSFGVDIGVVFERKPPANFAFNHEKIQIVQRALRLRRHRRHPYPREFKNKSRGAGIFALANEINEVERLVLRFLSATYGLDYIFKWDVLVRESFPDGISNLGCK